MELESLMFLFLYCLSYLGSSFFFSSSSAFAVFDFTCNIFYDIFIISLCWLQHVDLLLSCFCIHSFFGLNCGTVNLMNKKVTTWGNYFLMRNEHKQQELLMYFHFIWNLFPQYNNCIIIVSRNSHNTILLCYNTQFSFECLK